jgi:hypothetical protein
VGRYPGIEVVKKLIRLLRTGWLACIPGGMLWALSPLGVYLSEYKYKTPDVFWRLFPSAPLLLLLALIGLRLRWPGRLGWEGELGFYAVLAGVLLTVAGDVGLFYLDLDSVYIMTAPAYSALRVGFVLLTAGSVLFGSGAFREGVFPRWGVLPFVLCSIAGLVAVSRDLDATGSVLWILFGLGWVWFGISLLVESAAPLFQKRPKRFRD